MTDQNREPADMRDLSEFCAEWDRFRPMVEDGALAQSGLDRQTRDVIVWMRRLTDLTLRTDI